MTLYEILQVDANAEQDVIEAAYKKLASKYHPDKNPELNYKITKKMSEINQAYSILKDPDKRNTYDAELTLKGLGRNGIQFSVQEINLIHSILSEKVRHRCRLRLGFTLTTCSDENCLREYRLPVVVYVAYAIVVVLLLTSDYSWAFFMVCLILGLVFMPLFYLPPRPDKK